MLRESGNASAFWRKYLRADAALAKRRRRRLERRWNKTESEPDRVAYRQACKEANKLIIESRENNFKKRIAESDQKDRWKVITDLLHCGDNAPTSHYDDAQDLCNSFSSFFVSKIANIKQHVATVLKQAMTFLDPPHNGDEFARLPIVTPAEVYKILTNMPSKTSSIDFISTKLLKECAVVFSDIIAYLANLSFKDGCFPGCYKSAAVIPRLKKTNLDVKLPTNYRPISNLNNISKVLERLFLNRFQSHVVRSPNYNSYQSAYRKNHSTETALTATMDYIYRAADRSESTVLVALDLSAAFDLVDHTLLLDRLRCSFGITGPALQWLASYLTQRTQVVTIGKFNSPIVDLACGVPQGSVIGPLLFTLYISPLAQLISRFGIFHQQFADDSQLYIALSPSNAVPCIERLEQCLSALQQWFLQNGLQLNADKSDCILFGTAQRLKTFQPLNSVDISGTIVPVSTSIKTLGVTIDANLTFNEHVKLLSNACYYHIRALRNIRSSIDLETAKSIACAIVNSRLDYANILLYGVSKANVLKLQRVQNTLARVVVRSWNPNTKTADLLKSLHWLPIHHRITFKLLAVTHKVMMTREPVYLASLIEHYSPTRSLRSSDRNLLVIPRCRLNVGARAFSVAAPRLWNALPDELRCVDSITSFRAKLKTHLFTQP